MTKQERIKELEIDVKVSRESIERNRQCIVRLTEALSELIKSYDKGGIDSSDIIKAKEWCLKYGNQYMATWYIDLNNKEKFEILNSIFGAEIRNWISEAFDGPFKYETMSGALNDGLHVLSRSFQNAEVTRLKGETK